MMATSTLGHDSHGLATRITRARSPSSAFRGTGQDPGAASLPAPQRPGRRMADAHDRRVPGAWRQRAASRGRTIALRSGGAFTGSLVMATTVTDDGVWEVLRG